MTPDTKPCRVCGQTKAVEWFQQQSRCCRDCESAKTRARYEKNRAEILARMKEYREKNRVEILAKAKARYEKNHVEILAKAKEYREKNRAEILVKMKARYEKNRAEILAKAKAYHEKNHVEILAKMKEYREKNREQRNRAQHRRYWQVERERNYVAAERIRTAKSHIKREFRRELRGPLEMLHALNAVTAFMQSLRDAKRGSAPLDVAIDDGLHVQHVRENLERIKARAAAHGAAIRAANKSRRTSETAARSGTVHENAGTAVTAPASTF
jgi:hypothetical protein